MILVLDLSRSMSAEQPSRRESALRALEQLADEFAETGGNRIALIAFAARPLLLFPLTQDYDHLRHTLTQISEDDIPKLSADDAVSGTRIGTALKLAVESYDPHPPIGPSSCFSPTATILPPTANGNKESRRRKKSKSAFTRSASAIRSRPRTCTKAANFFCMTENLFRRS